MRTIQVKENVFANNEKEASNLRASLAKKGVYMLNVMSSPGSGKTTTLISLIKAIGDRLKVAVMDVDIETSLDAGKIEAATGVKSLQINNCGLCHIDAHMTAESLSQFDVDGVDLLILENIGNLVCPAEFDTGAHKSVMILSVPEGDDKPLKYPLMFKVCDLIIINKIDTLPVFDFDMEKCRQNILNLNPNAVLVPVSAKTGEGIEQLAEMIIEDVKAFKKQQ